MIYSFITNKDLDVSIKQYFLDQLTSSVPHIVKTAEGGAFSLIKSKLNSRYDLTKLFPSIKEWDAQKAYTIGQYASKNDVVYKALQNSSGQDPVTNSTQWMEDDPRDKLLIIHCVNITCFYVAERGNLRKLSQDLIDGYNRAINWLEDVKHGDENPDFPLLEIGGMELRSGSNPKIDHYY